MTPTHGAGAQVLCDWLTQGLMTLDEAAERLAVLKAQGSRQAALAHELEAAIRHWLAARRAGRRQHVMGLWFRRLPVPTLPGYGEDEDGERQRRQPLPRAHCERGLQNHNARTVGV